MEITNILSRAAMSRRPSRIHATVEYLMDLPPGTDMMSLAGGCPAFSTFPFSGVSVDMFDGTNYKLSDAELASALQYGKTEGDNRLINFWKGLIETIYAPKQRTRRTLVTNGAELGIYLVFNAIIDPGDSVMLSSPVYSTTILKSEHLGANIIEIEEDPVQGGISIESLSSTLEQWPLEKPKPKILLICPTGSNPSGTNITAATKQEIYSLACQHDFLILEDDPYCFLNYSGEAPSSFLSIDIEGRVVRFDSLSKVLCPGFRLGFLTAPKPLADICELHMQTTIIHTCSISQAIVLGYFEHIGYEGFLQHGKNIANHYKTRRDITITSLNKHMSDIATWIVPRAGMFIWVKINDCEDTRDIAKLALNNGVCVLPGEAFLTADKLSSHVRIAFSLLSADKIDTAIERLAIAVRTFKTI